MSANENADVLPAADQPPDPAMAALLGALSGGGDPLALLYSQIGATNPQAAMLLQAMEQRRAQAAQIKDIEDEEACEERCRNVKHEPEPGTVQVNEEDLRALQDAARKAGDELEILRGRSDILARALGACYLCFGDNPLCPECAGVGAPGSLMPEPAEFRLYVVPALRRVRAAEAHQAHRAAHRREFQGVRPDRSHGPIPQTPATGSRQVEPPIQP